MLFGPTVLRNLLRVKRDHEAELRVVKAKAFGDNAPNVDFCLLERLAVSSSWQGKGIGTRAVRTALDEVDAAGWPCLISTNETRNISFYERLGFQIVHQTNVQVGDCSAVTCWYMLRCANNGVDRSATAAPGQS
jgi:predicted N-acetyltransferase YhbS